MPGLVSSHDYFVSGLCGKILGNGAYSTGKRSFGDTV